MFYASENKMKSIIIMILTVVLIFNFFGCAIMPPACTPADHKLYKDCIRACPECKMEVKNERKAKWLSWIPGFNIWYASDSFIKGFYAFIIFPLIFPYIASINETKAIARCKNVKATLDYCERVPSHQ